MPLKLNDVSDLTLVVMDALKELHGDDLNYSLARAGSTVTVTYWLSTTQQWFELSLNLRTGVLEVNQMHN